MVSVALFVENTVQYGIDLSHIDQRNPGFAGTSYVCYLVGHLLSLRDNGIDVTIYTTKPMTYATGVRGCLADSLEDAYRKCCEAGTDYLIVKHAEKYVDIIRRLPFGHTMFIIWCHNFVSFPHLTFYAKCSAIARLVCVGREQADIYRDHRAFLKTDWIYNSVDNYLFQMDVSTLTPVARRQPVVTFVGAIVPGKGFHLLAKAWPDVLKAVPDAQLYVIGNGKLYGDNIELGRWGLAEKHYEASFMKYLTDGDHLLPGVHLMGILGTEKYEILAKTKVGVPNPSGLTETFCNSGVEMQLMGAVIASKRCTGYMDTVKNGRLIDNPKHLAACIIECLHATDDRYAETRRAMEQNFSQEVAVRQWEKLLTEALPQGRWLNPLLPLANPGFELKRWKEYMRRAKQHWPWLYAVVPSVGFFTEFWKALKWAVWKRQNLRSPS